VRILILCEGNAETRDSWSGISKSVVDHLRAAGHSVSCGDVDLYGLWKYAALVATWSPRRFRWWVKYHLGALPFRFRSLMANRHVKRHHGELDIILQFGATFQVEAHGGAPVVLYCDGNARLAELGNSFGYSDVSALLPAERAEVVARELRVYAGAAHMMTFSNRLRASFINDLGVPPERVTTVYAGANFDLGHIPEPNGNRQGPPTIVFIGRSFRRKGGDLLIRAFSHVRHAIPDAQLIIAGPTDLVVDEPGVSCLGWINRDDPAQWQRLLAAYQQADVFCMPTRYEPFGLVFVEAMLFGLPCIGPDAWAIPEIIENGTSGLIVPPEDCAALVSALLAVLEDRGRAEEMGVAGRQRALRLFTWPAVIDRMTDIFHSITAPSGSEPRNDRTRGSGSCDAPGFDVRLGPS
jgi:glycosyltransferase involved in cell wall biosynthesis